MALRNQMVFFFHIFKRILFIQILFLLKVNKYGSFLVTIIFITTSNGMKQERFYKISYKCRFIILKYTHVPMFICECDKVHR